MKPKKLAILLGASLILSAAAQANTDAAGTSLKKTAQSESPYTSSTYTHADAFDGMTVYSGIDVSKFQPTIDWEKVKAAGTDFVIIRAGYRGYSSGSLQKDSCFESHVTGALAAGLKVGLYFYTEAINTTEAAEEAAYCIDLAKDYDITFPIAYDFELSNSSGRLVKANLSKSAATANCEAFCDAISDAGYTPMVYANKSDLTNKIDGTALSEKYGIWLAQYNTKATYTGTYQFWQYSSSGTVDGISGNVDCNFWYTSTSIDSNPFSTPSATDSSATQTSIEEAKFSSISKQTYTGNALTPTPALTLNGKTLTKGTDYTLSYTDNTNPGKATITAKGKGSYTGTVSAAFKIIPKAISTLKGKSASKAITLSWEEVALADGYEIYRKDSLNSS
ncbi:MAG: glycoside hydrolase family 25 protein, partial [Clostridiaceae bacterium]|nr:glycoside hydrolase family 25 protein [Clostridiaceae bacterium]